MKKTGVPVKGVKIKDGKIVRVHSYDASKQCSKKIRVGKGTAMIDSRLKDDWTSDERGQAFNTKIAGEVAEVAQKGFLVKFKMPFHDGLVMMMDRRTIDFWVSQWVDLPDEHRAPRLRMCEQVIKRAHKRQKRGKLTSQEADATAVEIGVWMAYQIAFNDGEKLVEPVSSVGGLSAGMN
jgi:hypothetical protein